MKLLSIMMIGICLTASATAQNPSTQSTPPDIEILSKSWRKATLLTKLDRDPFEANDQQRDEMLEQKKATEYNARRSSGEKPVRPETPDSKQPTVEIAKDPSVIYYYQTKIKNTGAKTIKSVDWVYVFIDAESKEEVTRFQCLSKVKINPGKSSNLIMNAPSPPSNVVNVKKVEKGQTQFIEQIVISRIEYNDGSIWQPPQN
jgi:hypothetical protein